MMMSFKNAFIAAAVTRQHILKQFIMFIMCVWGLGVEGEEEGGGGGSKTIITLGRAKREGAVP